MLAAFVQILDVFCEVIVTYIMLCMFLGLSAITLLVCSIAKLVKMLSTYMTAMLLTFLLVAGASAQTQPLTDRQYTKEISAILEEDKRTVYAYSTDEHIRNEASGAYIARAVLDLGLLERELDRFKHHASTRTNVDKYVAQLSRDIEDTPPQDK